MYGVGRRIKEARKKYGLSQRALAQRINKSKSAISSYEREDQMPPLDVLISLASALNVSLDYLAGFEPVQEISIRNLTKRQQRLVELVICELTHPTNVSCRLSQEQIGIIQEMICLFSGYPENI